MMHVIFHRTPRGQLPSIHHQQPPMCITQEFSIFLGTGNVYNTPNLLLTSPTLLPPSASCLVPVPSGMPVPFGKYEYATIARRRHVLSGRPICCYLIP